MSCGAIILYCLNLPPEVRYLTENIFIVGLTPSPKKPDAVQLMHLLDPVIDTILKYQPPGRHIVTHRHPNGTLVQTRVIPIIADLPAAREVGGFLSHSANCFCSFCTCQLSQVGSLDFTSWRDRTGAEVKQQAEAWHNLITIEDKKRQATATGVRWTSLHRLPYRDPVLHIILGFMHNWLEGILQHQLRKLWGIGRSDDWETALKQIAGEEQFSDGEITESADELEELRQEIFDVRTGNLDLPPGLVVPSEQASWSPPTSTGSQTPTPRATATPAPLVDFSMDIDDDTERDATFIPPAQTSFDFTEEELLKIRGCIRDVSLPTWVGRPPTNLGEKIHGKLKAEQYLILFTVIFPLILPEIWPHTADSDSVEYKMLQSFYYLVAATNIIISYKTSNAEAESFTRHYIAYRSSIQHLYSEFNSLPNHHYAMHNEALLKYWGPLAGLSEFPGERINGMLQKIKTNRHLCE